MDRQRKIELLKAIQSGQINFKAIKPLAGHDLRANTGDLSGIMYNDCEYPFYLLKSYQCNLTGQIFNSSEVLELMQERSRYILGVLPIIEKAGTSLYASGIILKSISKYEQIQLQFKEGSNHITATADRLR